MLLVDVMKNLVKRAFSMVGLGVYRLTPPPDNQKKLVIDSPIHHNSKEGLDEFYSDAEAVESYLDPGFYDRLLDLLRANGVDYDGKRVADVGCGSGGLLKAVQRRFQPTSLTGYEYSENALKIARDKVPDVEFLYLDVYEGTSREFEIVFCSEVLEHLLYPDRALQNILKMLSRGGTLLITVPNGRTDVFEGHINFWSPESWSVFLGRVCKGFQIKTGLTEDNQTNFGIITRQSTTIV